MSSKLRVWTGKVIFGIKWYLIYVVLWCVIFFFIFGTIDPELTLWQWCLFIPSSFVLGWIVSQILQQKKKEQSNATD